ncbi:MAG: hypothetical protein IKD64_04615 [Lachnospiraceae bacterium]|nr:hypothetical protein [Lachnospiraceae bacterium]
MYEQIRKQLNKKNHKPDKAYSEDMLNKSLDDLSILKEHMGTLGGRNLAPFIGAVASTLVDLILTACELATNLICWDHASPDGTYPFSSIKDLASIKKGCGLDVPVMARVHAKGLIDIKRLCDNSEVIDPNWIADLFQLAEGFLKEMFPLAGESADLISRAIKIFASFGKMFRETDFRDVPPRRLGLIVLPKSEEDYTDEELDEIFKRRSKKSAKHIVPVYIMEIMIKHSSEDDRLGATDVIKYLWKEYGIEMERKAISDTLKQLQEADFLCESADLRSKYWYDPAIIARKREDPFFEN